MEAMLPGVSGVESACKGQRPAFFPLHGKRIECPVYERYRLSPGSGIEGPAIIEELESTAIIHPGDLVEVDRAGNLVETLKK